jgi:hypothetical protein
MILRKGDMAILVSATSSPCTRLILFVLPTPIDRAQRDRNAALLEDSLQREGARGFDGRSRRVQGQGRLLF